MSKELAVGEIGVIDGVRVQCVKTDGTMSPCSHCAFLEYDCSEIVNCMRCGRSDHTDVYFKKVEE